MTARVATRSLPLERPAVVLGGLFAAILSIGMTGQSASAAPFTWTGSSGATWNTSATNWSGATGTPWNATNGPSNVAVFDSNALGTATVSGTVFTNGIIFSATVAQYRPTGGTINLAGTTPTLTLAASNDARIVSALAGTAGATVTSVSGSARDLFLQGSGTGLSGDWRLGAGVRVNMWNVDTSLGTGAVYLDSTSSNVDIRNGRSIANNFYIQGASQGGAIAFYAGNNTVSGSVGLLGNATIVSASGTNTLSGVISNSAVGNLTLNGSGILRLSNANTYTGTTQFASGTGTVVLAHANAVQNSTLATNSSFARIAFDSAVAGKSFTIGGLSGSQNIALQDNAATPAAIEARVGNNNATTTYSGTLSGAGSLTKIGNGSLTLSAVNTYTGATVVTGGTLALSSAGSTASSGTVTIGSAGSTNAVLDLTAKTASYAFGAAQTVGGIGTINIGAGKTVSAAGIWAPGNSIGSNAVTGNLSLSGTSQFELGTSGTSAASPGNSDFTAVSGTLTLGGNLALFDNANANTLGSYGAGSYRLFAAPSLSGTFASVTAPAGAATTRVGMVYTAGTASGQGVFANVYNLASAATTQTVNVGNTRVGTATTAAVTLVNTAPSNATFTETLSTGSFSSTTANFTASGAASGIEGGSSGSGTLLVGLGSGFSAGAVSGTSVLSLFSDAVNGSGLGQQAVGSQTVTITGGVYDYANATYAGGTLDFGIVHKGASVTAQTVAIGNQTVSNASYQDLLDVAGASSNTAVSVTGFTGLAASTNGATTQKLSVGVSTATAGSLSGTVSLNLVSNANGVSGLSNGAATVVGSPAAITTTGSVFSGNGIWNVNDSGSWGSGGNSNWTSTEGVQAAPGTFGGFASTDTATFGSSVASGTATISLGSSNPSLAAVTFNNSAARYQLSGGSLALDGGTSSAVVTVAAGSHGIGSGVALATTAVFDVATNSTFTLSGILSGPSAGITKMGGGVLTLDAANTFGGTTLVNAGTLKINGSVAGDVQVGLSAVLGGSGMIAGMIGGNGQVGPGNSPGILTAPSASLSDGLDFAFELAQAGVPAWSAATASGNDVLRLTDATTPLIGSASSGNVFDIYFVAKGQTYVGGLFTDRAASFESAIASATFNYFVRDSAGPFSYNGFNYSTVAAGDVTRSTIQVASADFSGGTVTGGYAMQFVVVPEPRSIAMAAAGIVAAAFLFRRRK